MTIKDWLQDVGANEIKRPNVDVVMETLNSDIFNDEQDVDVGKPLVILSNYFLYLKAQEGIIAGRVSYLLDAYRSNIEIDQDDLTNEKAKLAIIRPIIDGVKNKIDVLKKILDKQIRISYELRNVRS